ncbi:unnamed protein product [Gordionus sp. m RMFG-2023]
MMRLKDKEHILNISKWAISDVLYWLSYNGFDEYVDLFCKHKINGKVLLSLNEKDLKNYPLKMNCLGDIKSLIFLIRNLINNLNCKNTRSIKNKRALLNNQIDLHNDSIIYKTRENELNNSKELFPNFSENIIEPLHIDKNNILIKDFGTSSLNIDNKNISNTSIKEMNDSSVRKSYIDNTYSAYSPEIPVYYDKYNIKTTNVNSTQNTLQSKKYKLLNDDLMTNKDEMKGGKYINGSKIFYDQLPYKNNIFIELSNNTDYKYSSNYISSSLYPNLKSTLTNHLSNKHKSPQTQCHDSVCENFQNSTLSNSYYQNKNNNSDYIKETDTKYRKLKRPPSSNLSPYSNHNNRRRHLSSSQFDECHEDALILKLVLAFAYTLLSFLVTSFVMVIVHDRVPDINKYPPLPDIFLDNIPIIPGAFLICEQIGILLGLTLASICIFHKHRFIILRRLCALTGTVFLLRCVTMVITSLSVPGSHLECHQVGIKTSLEDKIIRALKIWSGFGMSLVGIHSCGDYMFSGHTVILTMLNFFITEYTPRSFYLVHTFSWVLNLFGIFFILAAHEHYSIDVFIAFYITTRLFLYYHSLANNRALRQIDRERIRTWFPMFSYFESRVESIVPNVYEIPFTDMKFHCFKDFEKTLRRCFALITLYYERILEKQRLAHLKTRSGDFSSSPIH